MSKSKSFEYDSLENGRKLLEEINEGIDQMLAGAVVPSRVVEVSEEVHAQRMGVDVDQLEKGP